MFAEEADDCRGRGNAIAGDEAASRFVSRSNSDDAVRCRIGCPHLDSNSSADLSNLVGARR